MLESANMPAVLIEMGYLTNADQARLLAGAEFQNTLVQALFDAVVRFRDALDDEHREGPARGATMRRGAIAVLIATVVIGLLIGVAAVLVVVGRPRGGGAAKTAPVVATRSAAADAPPAMLGRKIKARLFYVSEDGTRLTGVEREVVYGDGPPPRRS